MHVTDFLREGGTLADLERRYAIKAVRSRRDPGRVLLKYSQIDSPMGEPVVRECRGLILDESDGWRVISRSFDKFFNHGEGHAAPIDWERARVQEKLDGSLCVLYHDGGAWRVQTSGHPDAEGAVGASGLSFAGLFWSVFAGAGYALPGPGAKDLCLSFELMTAHNQVVVRHEAPRLVWIGVRDRASGAELPVGAAHAGLPGYEPVRSFPLRSFADIEASFAEMEPLRQEGYVVVDHRFHRVKVKHPGYVALHHMRDSLCPRRLLEVILAGESGELLAYFPAWREEHDRIRDALDALCAELEAEYERLREIPAQKDFALRAVKARLPAALFAVRAGKAPDIRAFLRRMPSDHLSKLL
jgi:hypothetical protein